MAPIFLHNTLSGEKERFTPLSSGQVGMYHCGPTVYNFAHIGNLRSYVFADLLRRTCEYNGLIVRQVINITDVGHLVSDADSGPDKMESAVAREKKSVAEIADFYTNAFFDDLKKLNIETKGTTFPKASEHIAEQIRLIQVLEKKGYTYKLPDGIYFDTSKFPSYGKLGNIDIEGLLEGARVQMNKHKRNPTDFALWKFFTHEGTRLQEWQSPWGAGFPGWHIECSAMSMQYLGETFDIHTGGIDHIPVHHNNEIAQSEGATGKKFVDYWLHNAFITIRDEKMAKSSGNFIRLATLEERGIHPLAYRYFLLMARYRTPVQFSFENMHAVAMTYEKMKERITFFPNGGRVNELYQNRFKEYINDDLDTPRALALLWEVMKDDVLPHADKKATVLDFDRVFALNLGEKPATLEIPAHVKELAKKREGAREKGDWKEADLLRKKIEKAGFSLKDTPEGTIIVRF